MNALFGAPDTPDVEPLPTPPSRSDAEVQAAALDERKRRGMAQGRSSTILTSGQGVKDEVTTKSKTLLGEV